MAFVRATVALTSIAKTITAPVLLLSLAQCGFGGVFFPNFAIFELVSVHHRNFSFSSWASHLVLPFLLRLPILLSLSPKVPSLGFFFAADHLLWWSLFLCLEIFLSVVVVLCLLPPPAGGHVGSC